MAIEMRKFWHRKRDNTAEGSAKRSRRFSWSIRVDSPEGYSAINDHAEADADMVARLLERAAGQRTA